MTALSRIQVIGPKCMKAGSTAAAVLPTDLALVRLSQSIVNEERGGFTQHDTLSDQDYHHVVHEDK